MTTGPMSKTLKHSGTLAGGAALALAFTAPAFAHPGHGEATFLQGLVHPFSGADHLLAMIAVGLWASLRGGKALWAWPVAFVTAMLGGFWLGQAGGGLPIMEPAILASVIVLGTATAAALPLPTLAGAALVGAFGLAHGSAHGIEAPANAGGFPLGFVLSTAGLHLIGLGAGFSLVRSHRPTLVRWLGAGAAAGGLVLALTA